MNKTRWTFLNDLSNNDIFSSRLFSFDYEFNTKFDLDIDESEALNAR